jgi:hypothetical protein
VVPVLVTSETDPVGIAVPLAGFTAIDTVTCVAGVTVVALSVSEVVVATCAVETTETGAELLAANVLLPANSAVTV